ncbi:hypothetical protein JTE90_011179 [Oedothorax gibbosus]|uniref:Uncharacterized protein n=1 Tax=Oedothorax gibbosus TaxID=931172 RepID=A0AAV6VZP1_9ARAC|nr:hypothetical protein JTE90_011179 [Oedothorax gibbosus]
MLQADLAIPNESFQIYLPYLRVWIPLASEKKKVNYPRTRIPDGISRLQDVTATGCLADCFVNPARVTKPAILS